MKKIRILTYIDTLDNYGQVLQGYALQRFLRDNYPQFDVQVFYETPFISPPQSPAKPAKNGFGKQIYAKLKAAEKVVRTYFHAYIMRREKYIKRLKEQALQRQKECERREFEAEIDEKAALIAKWNEARDFAGFKRAHIALNCDELRAFEGYKAEFAADCYIVGSDQVWNGGDLRIEHFHGGKHWLDFYTLNFLPKDSKARKISYAASLGKREFGSDFEKWYFKDALSKFDAISVRESCNIKTLAELGLSSVCVPDPTQLLSKNDYEKLINSANINELSGGKVRKDSVFVYMLGNETAINKDEAMNFLCDKFGENAVIYTNANVDFSCKSDFERNFAATPQEWLACVRDTKLVVTNSFHGCAFCVLMNTPFVALKLDGGASPTNTRFEQLLGLFGLQNRLVSNLDELKAVMNEPIAWDEINAKLAKWRTVGVNFLGENLKNL